MGVRCLPAGDGDAATTTLDRPAWAAGSSTGLSRFVNAVIASPVYPLMKKGARDTLISTAEKNGIAWRKEAERLRQVEASTLEPLQRRLEDPGVSYPDYYTRPFHAYAEGNLSWLAARECESATMSMALRVWKDEVKAGTLGAAAAQERLRSSFLACVEEYRAEVLGDEGAAVPGAVLDVGCSVGMSTQYAAARWPSSRFTGLDLSSYFLAVAAHREAEAGPGGWGALGADGTPGVTWRHGNAEATGLDADSLDLTSLCFVFHECPDSATKAIMAEMHRVLRPGGTLALTDNNPRSPVIQNLPPVLFTLMKSTEPWSDEYYAFDMEQALRDVGFTHVRTVNTDPRHRTVLGTK